MIHNHGNTVRETGVNNLITVKTDQQSLIINQPDNRVVEVRTGPIGPMGRVDTGSLIVTASAEDNRITFTKGDDSTFVVTVDTGSSGTIHYIDTANNDNVSDLRNIKIYDYDTVNSVNFNGTDQTLTLILGTPNPPTATIAVSGFETDRFSLEQDSYIVQSSWNSTTYNIVRTTLYEDIITVFDNTVMTGIVSPISENRTTSGSHNYTFIIQSRNPVTDALSTSTATITRTIAKSDPGNPTLTVTQTGLIYGFDNYTIENGDEGTLNYNVNYGTLNRWLPVTKYVDPVSPVTVTATAPVTLQGTAIYISPPNAEPVDIIKTKYVTNIYTRVKSLRIGISTEPISYYTDNGGANLLNLEDWNGIIYKDTINPNGQTVSITVPAGQSRYLYIVMDANYSLTQLIEGGLGNGILGFNTYVTDNGYRIYTYPSYQITAFPGPSTFTYQLFT
jgi:hypothetical protein